MYVEKYISVYLAKWSTISKTLKSHKKKNETTYNYDGF